MNHVARQSGSAGFASPCGRNPGSPGRRRELGRAGRAGRHDRWLGSSSTVAKRCDQTKGEVSAGLRREGALARQGSDPAGQGGALPSLRADARVAGAAGGGTPGQHVAVDPGRRRAVMTEHPAWMTEHPAYRHTSATQRGTGVKRARLGPADTSVGPQGGLVRDTRPHRWRVPRGAELFCAPSGRGLAGLRGAVGGIGPSRAGSLASLASLTSLARWLPRRPRLLARWLPRSLAPWVTWLPGCVRSTGEQTRGGNVGGRPWLLVPGWPGRAARRRCAGCGVVQTKTMALSRRTVLARGGARLRRSEAAWKEVATGARLDRSPQAPHEPTGGVASAAALTHRRTLKGHRSNYFQV